MFSESYVKICFVAEAKVTTLPNIVSGEIGVESNTSFFLVVIYIVTVRILHR
jgi:hypothetical protein